MKANDRRELHQRSIAELEEEVASLRRELFDARIAASVEGKGDGGQAARMRRQVARCLTIINLKKKAEVQA